MLARVRSLFGDVWSTYQAVLAGQAKYMSGHYVCEVLDLTGARIPFRRKTLVFDHPIEYGQVYLHGSLEEGALRLCSFVRMEAGGTSSDQE